MNPIENIISVLPIDTKIVDFNLASDGTIESVSVKNIDGLIPNDRLAANIIIACYLACFGVDVASVSRNNVQLTDWRVTDMANLLINAKWETTEVTRGGTTYTAMEYINKFFSIYDKEEFVNVLFMNVIDNILHSDSYDDEYLIIGLDDDTYQMIKLLAFCFGANQSFTSAQVGEQTGINIPFDPLHLDVLEGYVYDIMVEKGLISDTIGKANFHFSSDIHHMFEDSPLNSDGFFKYAHFSYIQCPTPKTWMACIYFTGVELREIKYTPLTYAVNHGGRVIEAIYTAQPVDTNGTTLTDDNLMGSWTQIGPLQWVFAPNLPEYNVFSDAMESRGACFCKRTNCDLIVDENTVHYDVVRYDSSQGSNHYINTFIPANWWHLPYGNNGDGSLQITSRYFVRSNKETGDNVVWGTSSGQPWEGLPTTLPSPFTDSAEKHDVILNNILLGEIVTIPDIEIDSRTQTDLTDDMDNTDLSNDAGWMKIIFNSIQLLMNGITPLKPHNNIFDIIDDVKIRYVDIAHALDIKTGNPIEPILENTKKEYSPFYNTYIEYFNKADDVLDASPGACVYKLDRDNINKVMQEIWADNPFQNTFKYGNIEPNDCVLGVYTLPFSIDNVDYDPLGDRKVYIGNTYFKNNIRGDRVTRPYKILTTDAVLVGGQKKNPLKLKKGRNFLDFAPYSSASIYIPFVGERELDLNLVMYRYVYIQYRVHIYTGDFVATVYSMNYSKNKKDIAKEINRLGYTNDAYPVITATGNMAFEFPMVGRETTYKLNDIVGVLGGMASGGVKGVASEVLGLANNQITGGSGAIVTKGSFRGTEAYLSNWQPYITLYKHEAMRGFKEGSRNLAFNETRGLRTERSIKIGNMGSGYHKVNGCKLDGLQCTQRERAEIQRILEQEGFYISYSPS